MICFRALRYGFAALFCVLSHMAIAQILTPKIEAFMSYDYHAGLQNWEIKLDNDGRVYVANNEGLMVYDGAVWKLFQTPNKTIVRSIHVDSKTNRIYIGAQDEIGYFEITKDGDLKYVSLLDYLAETDRYFEDVWSIHSFQGKLFFQANKKVLIYSDRHFDSYEAQHKIDFLSQQNQHLFLHDVSKGLLRYTRQGWEVIGQHADWARKGIRGIISQSQNSYLVVTHSGDCYSLVSDGTASTAAALTSATFSGLKINMVRNLRKDVWAVGTMDGQIILIDDKGTRLKVLNKDNGLKMGAIRSVTADGINNIWVGTDVGVAYIGIDDPLQMIVPNTQQPTKIYDATYYNEELYLATAHGLLKLGKDQRYVKLDNSIGEVWNLQQIGHKLFVFYENGMAEIRDNQVRHIVQGKGTWVMSSDVVKKPDSYLIGTYQGLSWVRFDGPGPSTEHTVTDRVQMSTRFLWYDVPNKIAWLSHPYRGITKVTFDNNGDFITARNYHSTNGLPSDMNNYVFHIQGRLVVSTLDGIYKYSAEQDAFVKSDFYHKLFGDKLLQYIKEDMEGNIWFVNEKKVGVVYFEGTKTLENAKIYYFPELTGRLIAGFEKINPISGSQILFGGYEGLFQLDFDKFRKRTQFYRVQVSSVKSIGAVEKMLYGGFMPASHPKDHLYIHRSIDYTDNAIEIVYAATGLQEYNMTYSSFLVGIDKDWSSWSTEQKRSYFNLPPGKYEFQVKAKTNVDQVSPVQTVYFEILPPWYLTVWAKVCYVILAIVFFYYLISFLNKRHQRILQQQQYLHDLELKANQQLIGELENEKLINEIQYKNKELSLNTMHLLQRGKLLSTLNEELRPALKNRNEDPYAVMERMSRFIKNAERSDQDWEQFVSHFDKVNNNYLSRLKKAHPTLTSNDLRLCAYIILNFNNKEISQLLNVTGKAIEVSRYRLRKKLALETEEGLFDYLSKFNMQ